MKSITTIFFDIDNTLINHSLAQNKAIEAVRKANFPKISKQKFVTEWKKNQEKFWELYMRNELTYKEQRTQRIIAVWNTFGQTIAENETPQILELLFVTYQQSWQAFPQVVITIQQLSNKGYKLGIITNGNKEQQVKKLQRIDVLQYIDKDLFFASEEVGFSKPNPEIFLLAQEKAKAPTQAILFIGDDPVLDVAPAKKLGWKALLVDHFGKEAEKKPLLHFREIIEILA